MPFSYLKIQLSCFLIRTLFLFLWHSSKPREEQSLVKWASLRLHDYESLEEMIDPGIRKTCSSKALSNFADIISLCIQVVFNSITQLNIWIAKFELFLSCLTRLNCFFCLTETWTASEGIPTTNVWSCGISNTTDAEAQHGERKWSRWYPSWPLWEIFPFNQHPLHGLTYIELFFRLK